MFCSKFFLYSIENSSRATRSSKTFMVTILITIASNAPECATIVGSIVGTAQSGIVDFAVRVIAGSILQVALFVLPVLVMLGWIVQQPMDLNFETLQPVLFFLAIVLINHLLQNRKHTYMHGLVLIEL
jgi:Ca2+:H+ antiporter